MFVRSRTPRATSGSSASRSIERNAGSRRALSCTERRRPACRSSTASASAGAAVRSARTPGRSSANSPSVFARNGRVRGQLPGGRVERRRPAAIDCCSGVATVASAANVVSRLRNSAAWVSADRRHDPRRPPERPDRARQLRPRVRQVAHDRHERQQQRVEPSIARLRSAPRPANTVPNSSMFVAPGRARAVVEGVEDLVELDRLRRRLAHGDRRAVLEPAAAVPPGDLRRT